MKLIENTGKAKYRRAKKHVKRLRGFYQHLVIYLIFVVFFIFLNISSSDFPWAIFPIVGWGIGVLGHASATFGFSFFFGKDWEKRKIREFMKEEDETMRF